jgi:putative PIN family toxin of toxin-antitoxin system
MIRVVIDTNIIVSALLQPLGPPAQVFLLAVSGSIQLCITGEVYAEYEEVIRRPRFRRDESVIIAALDSIREKVFGSARRKASGIVPIPTTTSSWSVLKPPERPIW